MITIVNIAELAPPFNFPYTFSGSLDLYSYGYDILSGNLDLYSEGHETANSNLDLYSIGAIQVTSGVNLVAFGQNKYIRGGLDLYALADTTTPTSSLDLYAYVSSVGFPEGDLDLFARVAEGGTIDCIAFGPGYSAEESIYMYSFGANGITGGLDLSIPDTTDDFIGSITLYACGY